MRQECEPFVKYQVEHVTARQHGGGDDDHNLALACTHCNLHKGPNLAGLDPLTGSLERLFNPRLQSWDDHFEELPDSIVGITACGRATVNVLAMNADVRMDLRRAIRESDESK